MEEQYTVRAASASELARKKYILGKFPNQAPNIVPKQGQWSLQRNDQDGNQQLILQRDKPNPTKYTGRADGGLVSSAPSNYFLLVRSGKEFITIPVSEWATFKQEGKRLPLQLEEAEAQMKFQRLQAERINPRLAKAVDGGAPSSPTAAASQPAADDDEADSDEEWKDIKARAASRATVDRPRSRSSNDRTTPGNTTAGGTAAVQQDDDYDNAPQDADGIYVPKPRDAEDWEHESEAADDDLDMGGPSDEDEEAGLDLLRGGQHAAMSDSDGEMNARKVEKTIKRMLQDTGLEDSEVSDDDDDDEDEDDEDEEDLDRMANELLDGGQKSPSVVATGEQSGKKSEGVSKKRKTPPTVSSTPIVGQTISMGGDSAAGGVKKVKASPSQQSVGGGSGAVTLTITEDEVVALLKQHGGEMPLSEVGKHFKSRVTNAAEKAEFGKLLKRIVSMKPGKGSRKETYVQLK